MYCRLSEGLVIGVRLFLRVVLRFSFGYTSTGLFMLSFGYVLRASWGILCYINVSWCVRVRARVIGVVWFLIIVSALSGCRDVFQLLLVSL